MDQKDNKSVINREGKDITYKDILFGTKQPLEPSNFSQKMRLVTYRKRALAWLILTSAVFTIIVLIFSTLGPICLCNDEYSKSSVMLRAEKYMKDANQKVYSYNREIPLIFIGGVPRSGTTLMRAMLDAHPDVRCGQETHIIPALLYLHSTWMKAENKTKRLKEAGITKEVFNSAIAKFCLEVITKHGEPAPRLCNKDPLTLEKGSYINELFPNSKFLFMVRDGRATVHSIVSRKVGVKGFNNTNYRQSMETWNYTISDMYDQCKNIGNDGCMMVFYEQLILHTVDWMKKILKFLDLPWNDSVLHHEEFVNKTNGVHLSKVEFSSDQVIKPVNLEGLSKWVGQMPDDVVHDMAEIAPMLSVLGYDPYANPPDYGKPDAWVKDNTDKVKENREIWENKAKEMKFLHLEHQEKKN